MINGGHCIEQRGYFSYEPIDLQQHVYKNRLTFNFASVTYISIINTVLDTPLSALHRNRTQHNPRHR